MLVDSALAASLAAAARSVGGRVVVAGGAFDILHVGHLDNFRYATELVGTHGLVFAITGSDENLRQHKGKLPVVTALERAELVAAIRYVDHVTIIYSDAEKEAYLRSVRPDYYVRGPDWTPETFPEEERRLMAEVGGQCVTSTGPKRNNSSRILELLRSTE